MIELLAVIAVSYALGSIPTSIIIGRMLKGIDIREHGSGNAGGTNVLRVLGWKPGIFVMVFDIAKGWFATFYVSQIGLGALGINFELVQILAGISAVLGHVYTIFAGFKGGKGVGAAAGMLLALYPVGFLISLAVFIAIAFTTKYVSLSSMIAAVTLPITLVVIDKVAGMNTPGLLFYFSILVALLIIFTHRSNIKRLLNGTENKFGRNEISD